jgi:DNA-binding response OmpR family regulator
MRILLVEDDAMLGEATRSGLTDDGFAVDWVETASAALAALLVANYSVVLLDIGLPAKSGMDMLAQMRRDGNSTPVIFLTARSHVQDRILGLNTGADDYIIKPFDLNEVAARVRALGRRAAGLAGQVISAQCITLDVAAKQVSLKGEVVELTAREYQILLYLMERQNRIVSRPQLEESLYAWNDELGSNAVEVYVHQLRKKLKPFEIKNVRGLGYVIKG